MNDILLQFADIISNVKVIQERNDSKVFELKVKITFIDNSIIEHTEILVRDIKKRKYSFHWMNKNFELLIRWDNASHFPITNT
jgi:hypothetical protein